MLTNQFAARQIDGHPGSITVPAGKGCVWFAGFVSTDKLDRYDTSLISRSCHFVMVKVEHGFIGVYQGEVLPSVPIKIQNRESSTVRYVVQSR